ECLDLAAASRGCRGPVTGDEDRDRPIHTLGDGVGRRRAADCRWCQSRCGVDNAILRRDSFLRFRAADALLTRDRSRFGRTALVGLEGDGRRLSGPRRTGVPSTCRPAHAVFATAGACVPYCRRPEWTAWLGDRVAYGALDATNGLSSGYQFQNDRP